MTLRTGSLFSGCDGLALGLNAVLGATTAWHAEVDPNASRVLEERWPGVPNVGSVVDARWEGVEPVDLLCGGPPCQPTSVAGKRLGVNDERWMWPAALDAMRRVRPRWVVWENPSALLGLDDGRPFGRILSEMAEAGYVGRWRCLRASDVGAPHGRERVFLLAADAERRPERSGLRQGRSAGERGRRPGDDDGEAPADADGARRQGSLAAVEGGRRRAAGGGEPTAADAGRGERDSRSPAAAAGGGESSGRGQGVAWGLYEPVVRRWERLLRPHPYPVGPGGGLSPAFVEWMLGFPAGHVSETDVSKTAQIRILGNSVQVQCAYVVGLELVDLVRGRRRAVP